MAADLDKPVAVDLGTHREGLAVALDIHHPEGLAVALDIHHFELVAVAQDTCPGELVVAGMQDYFEDILNTE